MTALEARLAAEFGAAQVDVCTARAGGALCTWPRLTPPDVDAVAAALRFAGREQLRIVPAGAATHLYRTPEASRADFVLSLRGLDRVREYEPEDMVAVVEAGTTLAALDALASPYAQRLGPDPWPGGGATLGGAVAANRTGIARRSRGTWRDAVLGARVLHADGRSSKTGGKVVKNVTGFDLAKLYVGSCGTLVLLTEINLRLVPRPPVAGTLVTVQAAGRLPAALAALAAGPFAPASCTALQGNLGFVQREFLPPVPADAVCLVLRFEGRDAVVRAQLDAACALLDGIELDAARGLELDAALRAACEPAAEGVLARIRALPTALPAVLAACRQHLGADVRVLGMVGAGEVLVHAPDLPPAPAAAWRQSLHAAGARVRIEAGPGSGAALHDDGDPVAAGLARGIKRALDPAGRFAGEAVPAAGERS